MSNTVAPEKSGPNTSLLIRGAIWIAIGALIAAALVCVVWVLLGDQQGLIGRAFLTIVLLAGFAGIAILEAGLARNRSQVPQACSRKNKVVTCSTDKNAYSTASPGTVCSAPVAFG